MTNTLAYYTKVFITSVKRFLGEPPSTEMIEKRERERGKTSIEVENHGQCNKYFCQNVRHYDNTLTGINYNHYKALINATFHLCFCLLL
jgi:hypothetical protein